MKTDNTNSLPDEEIINMYWNREERAIAATDEKYGKYLYKIAYNIVHDRLDCEECLNDTYLGAWNKIPPHKPNVFQVFLARITRNVAVDKYRRNTAARKIPSEMISSLEELEDCLPCDGDDENAMLIAEISKVLNSFLRKLSERDEFIFVCRYYYSDKIMDIAKMLQVSEKTVQRALASIRERLKECLEKEGISI